MSLPNKTTEMLTSRLKWIAWIATNRRVKRVCIRFSFKFYWNDEYIPGGKPIAGCPGLIICAANCGDGASAIAGLIMGCINGIGVEATGTWREIQIQLIEYPAFKGLPPYFIWSHRNSVHFHTAQVSRPVTAVIRQDGAFWQGGNQLDSRGENNIVFFLILAMMWVVHNFPVFQWNYAFRLHIIFSKMIMLRAIDVRTLLIRMQIQKTYSS